MQILKTFVSLDVSFMQLFQHGITLETTIYQNMITNFNNGNIKQPALLYFMKYVK